MKIHLSALNVEGLEDTQVHVATIEHPSHRNPVNNLGSKYQLIRIARGNRAIFLCFDHPNNIGASVFNGLEDIRMEGLSRFPVRKDEDVWYVGQQDGKRYVYTLVEFDKNGWPIYNDRIPTSSLAHQYDISFETLSQLVRDVREGDRATEGVLPTTATAEVTA